METLTQTRWTKAKEAVSAAQRDLDELHLKMQASIFVASPYLTNIGKKKDMA